MIVVLAPGKGSYFPEYIPDNYRPDSIGKQNYTAYYNALHEQQIDVIGGNDWYTAMKDSSSMRSSQRPDPLELLWSGLGV